MKNEAVFSGNWNGEKKSQNLEFSIKWNAVQKNKTDFSGNWKGVKLWNLLWKIKKKSRKKRQTDRVYWSIPRSFCLHNKANASLPPFKNESILVIFKHCDFYPITKLIAAIAV